MPKRVSVDKWLFGVTLLLVFIGLIMVFSASAVIAKDRFGSPYSFVVRQLMWALAGLLSMVLMMNFDYRRLKSASVVFTILGLTTLLLLAVFFLDRHANTHRWIRFAGFSLQPSELAKPAIILFLAYFLEKRYKSITDWRRTLLPAGCAHPDLHRADRERTRPRHRHGGLRHHRRGPVYGGNGDEVLWLCRAGLRPCRSTS